MRLNIFGQQIIIILLSELLGIIMSGRRKCVSGIGPLWKQLNKISKYNYQNYKEPIKAHMVYGRILATYFGKLQLYRKVLRKEQKALLFNVSINWWWISKTKGKITPTHKQTQGTSRIIYLFILRMWKRDSHSSYFKFLKRRTSQSIDVVYLLRALSISSCILHFEVCWICFGGCMMNIKHIFYNMFYFW